MSLIRLTPYQVSQEQAHLRRYRRLKIAVSEAVTNAVKHAYKMMKQMV